MAYFRLHRKYALTQVLSDFVDKKYYYETEREMFRVNVVPVCMDTITPDEITLPPRLSEKRTSGRPKKKRFRTRLSRASDEEDTRVRCSRCNGRGHNVRTCNARDGNHDDDNDDRKPSPVMRQDMDLS